MNWRIFLSALFVLALFRYAATFQREKEIVARYAGDFNVAPPQPPRESLGFNQFQIKGTNKNLRVAVAFLLEAQKRRVIVSAEHVFVGSFTFLKTRAANESLPHKVVLGDLVIAESGKATLPTGASLGSVQDTSGDFVVMTIKKSAPEAKFLRLAQREPLIGEPLWLYTVTDQHPNEPRLYRAKVAFASNKVIRLENAEGSPPMTSGSPILNAQGEVMGVLALLGTWNGTPTWWIVPVAALQRFFR